MLEESEAPGIRLYLMAFYLDKEESLSPEIFIISTILTAVHVISRNPDMKAKVSWPPGYLHMLMFLKSQAY